MRALPIHFCSGAAIRCLDVMGVTGSDYPDAVCRVSRPLARGWEASTSPRQPFCCSSSPRVSLGRVRAAVASTAQSGVSSPFSYQVPAASPKNG